MRLPILASLAATLALSTGAFAEGTTVHVIANDHVAEVAALDDPADLWISGDQLEEATGFKLKPEGACLDDICIPIDRNADNDLYVNRDGRDWINVSKLADKLGQAYAVDREEGVWSFGSVPAVRESTLVSAIAPDFELKDRKGDIVRLSDFRGKKVLLVTWASW